jgi:16S rRNA (uracil1498-N3)-methyltransferase
MSTRFHADLPFSARLETALPEGATRHVQVLRLQPGEHIILFDGRGQEWSAEILSMGRRDVQVRMLEARSNTADPLRPVTLAAVMPAGDRFDWLVEKATELGVSTIQPLMSERSVLRLSGDRAERKVQHWQGVAIAAAEQCGRAHVPVIAPVEALRSWLQDTPATTDTFKWLLSLGESRPLSERLADLACPPLSTALCMLSGPEGGLTAAEEAAARSAGFLATSLGPRVLRAETAPLAVLSTLLTLG